MRYPVITSLVAVLVPATSTLAWGQIPRIVGMSVERFYVNQYYFTAVNYRRTDLGKGGPG